MGRVYLSSLLSDALALFVSSKSIPFSSFLFFHSYFFLLVPYLFVAVNGVVRRGDARNCSCHSKLHGSFLRSPLLPPRTSNSS